MKFKTKSKNFKITVNAFVCWILCFIKLKVIKVEVTIVIEVTVQSIKQKTSRYLILEREENSCVLRFNIFFVKTFSHPKYFIALIPFIISLVRSILLSFVFITSSYIFPIDFSRCEASHIRKMTKVRPTGSADRS